MQQSKKIMFIINKSVFIYVVPNHNESYLKAGFTL